MLWDAGDRLYEPKIEMVENYKKTVNYSTIELFPSSNIDQQFQNNSTVSKNSSIHFRIS